MTELEILQHSFNDIAWQFPGLTHVLSVSRIDRKEPVINRKYVPTKDSLLVIWGDGLIGENIPGKRVKHWLVKPANESWNLGNAQEKFSDLSGKAGRALLKKDFFAHLSLPRCLLKLADNQLNQGQSEQLWALVVHHLGNKKAFTRDPSDIKASILHDIKPDEFDKKPLNSYYEVQKDFLLESALVISNLLEIENGDPSTKLPEDLITLAVATSKYSVSSATLNRAISDGRLNSYRPTNSAKNQQHKIQESKVASFWQRK